MSAIEQYTQEQSSVYLTHSLSTFSPDTLGSSSLQVLPRPPSICPVMEARRRTSPRSWEQTDPSFPEREGPRVRTCVKAIVFTFSRTNPLTLLSLSVLAHTTNTSATGELVILLIAQHYITKDSILAQLSPLTMILSH